MLHSPRDQYDYGMDPRDQDDYYGPSAEDAAREFEDSILGTAPELQMLDKGKGKQPAKRPAVDAMSDGSSDLEVPAASKRDNAGHATKKRKVDKDAADMADELERSITSDLLAASSAKPGPSAKGKGKTKQSSLRDGTPDSISATPKPPRKKPGPKKKLDHLPSEFLGLGSGPPSASGDVTPSISRPSSPALTATSNIVYELDEPVPPLKRAKKIDDAAMLKRVKNLEEAQRKVWTNIARRDVAKVVTGNLDDNVIANLASGVQIPCYGLSIKASADEASCDAVIYAST